MSMPALLLRLMLAVLLVVNGTTGAAAAVHAQAGDVPADAAMASHGGGDCHGDDGMAMPDAPVSPTPAPADDCDGCATGTCACTCMSLVHVALPAPMAGLAPAPRVVPAPVPASARTAPPLPLPIRPPIGQG